MCYPISIGGGGAESIFNTEFPLSVAPPLSVINDRSLTPMAAAAVAASGTGLKLQKPSTCPSGYMCTKGGGGGRINPLSHVTAFDDLKRRIKVIEMIILTCK